MKWPRSVGPIVEIDQRLVLRHDDGVEPPVVVEVADRQAAPEVERPERVRRRSETSIKPSAGAAFKSCNGIVQGNCGRGSSTWPLAESTSSHRHCWRRERRFRTRAGGESARPVDRAGVVGEEALAEIAIKGGRLAEEVGHGQVDAAVAVEVAAGDPHAGLEAAVGAARRRPAICADLLEPEPAQVARTDSWPTCHWRRRGRSGRRRRGRRRRRPGLGRPGRRSRPRRSRRRTGRRRCERRGRAARESREGCNRVRRAPRDA